MKTSIIKYRKIIGRLVLPLLAAMVLFSSCDDWTDLESKYEPDQIGLGEGKDEAYYANLRAYKATMRDRKISWGWYSGWTAEGSYMLNSLAGVADSLDIIALWGSNWKRMTPAMAADLKYVKEVKGTKVITTHLMGGINWLDYLPEDVPEDKWEEWYGWEGELRPKNSYGSDDTWVAVTEKQEAAIRKYTRLFAQEIIDAGLDGVDFDWEGSDTKGTLASYQNRIWVFIDELSTIMGPKSGSDMFLILDGHANAINPKIAPYFDLFVWQAYNATTMSSLNTSFTSTVNNFKDYLTPEEIAPKFVVTANYEQGMNLTGGRAATLDDGTKVNSLKLMALWNPTYNGITYPRSGGAGAFHVEYEYAVAATNGFKGFYPWTREAIQVMNPAGIE
ncbi:MAG: glycoside hydrolase family 18 [Dysgonomonas sp.]|nr:glycoside hydrolase family 18 [Dysgonomonas sp.]